MLRIGHRGAMGHAPENTLVSFQKALELKVDMIELDVQLCKTGELVVIHDLTVDRTTNGIGYVSELTLEELKHLDAGEGQSIPLLVEVLDVIDRKAKVNIELKGKGTAEKVGQLIYEYIKNNGWSQDDFIVSSFDHQELKLFKQGYPKIPVGLLIYHLPYDLAQPAEDFKAQYLNASLAFYSKELVVDAHERGIQVLIYTVNEEKDIERCRKDGVDGVFSNYPDRV